MGQASLAVVLAQGGWHEGCAASPPTLASSTTPESSTTSAAAGSALALAGQQAGQQQAVQGAGQGPECQSGPRSGATLAECAAALAAAGGAAAVEAATHGSQDVLAQLIAPYSHAAAAAAAGGPAAAGASAAGVGVSAAEGLQEAVGVYRRLQAQLQPALGLLLQATPLTTPAPSSHAALAWLLASHTLHCQLSAACSFWSAACALWPLQPLLLGRGAGRGAALGGALGSMADEAVRVVRDVQSLLGAFQLNRVYPGEVVAAALPLLLPLFSSLVARAVTRVFDLVSELLLLPHSPLPHQWQGGAAWLGPPLLVSSTSVCQVLDLAPTTPALAAQRSTYTQPPQDSPPSRPPPSEAACTQTDSSRGGLQQRAGPPSPGLWVQPFKGRLLLLTAEPELSDPNNAAEIKTQDGSPDTAPPTHAEPGQGRPASPTPLPWMSSHALAAARAAATVLGWAASTLPEYAAQPDLCGLPDRELLAAIAKRVDGVLLLCARDQLGSALKWLDAARVPVLDPAADNDVGLAAALAAGAHAMDGGAAGQRHVGSRIGGTDADVPEPIAELARHVVARLALRRTYLEFCESQIKLHQPGSASSTVVEPGTPTNLLALHSLASRLACAGWASNVTDVQLVASLLTEVEHVHARLASALSALKDHLARSATLDALVSPMVAEARKLAAQRKLFLQGVLAVPVVVAQSQAAAVARDRARACAAAVTEALEAALQSSQEARCAESSAAEPLQEDPASEADPPDPAPATLVTDDEETRIIPNADARDDVSTSSEDYEPNVMPLALRAEQDSDVDSIFSLAGLPTHLTHSR
ncbi:hypothetical protein V8C86DRAFT_1627873 [Haematococcus lacustris]